MSFREFTFLKTWFSHIKDLIQYLQEKVIGAIYIGSTIPQTKYILQIIIKYSKPKNIGKRPAIFANLLLLTPEICSSKYE